MKRIRSNKRQREEACQSLSRIYQGSFVSDTDVLGNKLPEAHDKLRVFIGGAGLYKFKFVDSDTVVSYLYGDNEVAYVTVNDVVMSYESPAYDRIAQEVYKLVDKKIKDRR